MRSLVPLGLTLAVSLAATGCGARTSSLEPAPTTSSIVNPVGTYDFRTTTFEGHDVAGKILVQGSPGAYRGSMTSPGLPDIPIESIRIEGHRMVLSGSTPAGPLTIELEFEGHAFTGEWRMAGRTESIRGHRAAPSSGSGSALEVRTSAVDSLAVRRLEDLLSLIGSGDRDAARAFAQDQMVPRPDGTWVDSFVDGISGLHDRTRGLDAFAVDQIMPTRVVAKLRHRLSGNWEGIDLRLEETPPHRIANHLIYGPVNPPAEMPDSAPANDAELVRMTDSLLRLLSEADVFSGAVLLARDDQVLYRAAFGEAEKSHQVANTPTTRFNLASLDKMFTAVAIAQLVDEGKLSYEDPLGKHLPEFPSPEAARRIRIKHLLTHTSGLGDYMTDEWRSAPAEQYRTLDDFLALVHGQSPAFEPGTRMRYSNAGFLILGRVIGAVTRREYKDYISEQVLQPAEMRSTGAVDLDYVYPAVAVGYEKEYTDEGVHFRNNLYDIPIRGGPAGGGYSTVEDLFRFTRALVGGRLLAAGSTREMLSPKPELHAPENGYGFLVDLPRGVAGHGGGSEGVSNFVLFPLNRGYTLIVLSNYGSGRVLVMDRVDTWLKRLEASARESSEPRL